jgi:hypothetical protein
MRRSKDHDSYHVFMVIFYLLVFFNADANAQRTTFNWKKEKIEIRSDSTSIISRKNGVVIFNLTTNPTNEVKVTDFNFDGYPDISVLRDSGVEKYYDIYLFQEKAASFKINKELSALACPEPEEKSRTIISSCNHASACETWTDTYKFRKEKLVLIRREGRSCDPSNGDEFRYSEIYENGKLVKEQSAPPNRIR